MARRNVTVDASESDTGIDPDAVRARELAEESDAAGIQSEDMEDMFRVSDEISATEGVRLVFVRRLPPDQKGHVGEMTPAEFTIERAREMFGPGTYSVRAIGPKGYMAGCGGKLIIAARPKQEQLSLEQILEKIDARNQQRTSSRVDMLEVVKVVGPLVVPIVGALLTRQSPQPDIAALIAALKPQPVDPLPMIAALKQLMPPPAPQQNQPDAIERALKLVEFIRDKAPVGEGESGWLDIIKEGVRAVGPNLGKLLENLPQIGAAQSAGSAPGTNPVPVPASTAPARSPALLPAPQLPPSASSATAAGSLASPGPENGDMNLSMLRLLPWFRTRVEMLLSKAATGRAVEVWAEAFLDEFPDDIDPAPFMELLAQPQWFELFKQFDARVAQFEPWFREFRDYLLAALGEMQQEASAEAAGATTGTREVLPTEPGARLHVLVRGPEPPAGQAVGDSSQPAVTAQKPAEKTRQSTEIQRPGPVPTDPVL